MRIEVNIDGTITEHEDASAIERPIEEIEAERIQAIKAKASELIKSKYPIEKQSSAQLGIYGEQYLMDMKEYIARVIVISNEAEANGVKIEDILWQ